MESYGIDPRQFAQLIQRRVAGSANAVPSEQKGKGHDIVVQGTHAEFIYSYLLGERDLLTFLVCYHMTNFILRLTNWEGLSKNSAQQKAEKLYFRSLQINSSIFGTYFLYILPCTMKPVLFVSLNPKTTISKQSVYLYNVWKGP